MMVLANFIVGFFCGLHIQTGISPDGPEGADIDDVAAFLQDSHRSCAQFTR
jgi:hypothetical protein